MTPHMTTCKHLPFFIWAAINLLSGRIILHQLGAPVQPPQPWKIGRHMAVLTVASPDRSIYRAAHAARVAARVAASH